MDLYERGDQLFDIIEPYIIMLTKADKDGYCYKLKDNVPQEVIEADKEYRSFAKDLEPIR